MVKQRFRCMHSDGGDLTYCPQKACKIVVASKILHNMCINAGLPLEEEDLEQPVDNDYDDFPENCARNKDNANGWDVMPPLHRDTSELGVVLCGKEIWTRPHGTTRGEKTPHGDP